MAAPPRHDKGKALPPAPESLRSGSGPQAALSSFKSASSLTPRGRGMRFTSFDEAHQNITSRQGPSNPFQDSPQSPYSPYQDSPIYINNANNGPSDREFGQPIIGPPMEHDAPTYGATSTTCSSNSLQRRRSITAILPYIDFDSKPQKPGMDEKQTVKHSDYKASKVAHQNADISTGTTERIYDNYGGFGHDQASSSIDSSGHGYTFAAESHPLELEPPSRQGAVNRGEFKGEGFRGPQRKLHETAKKEACLSTQLSSLMSETDFVQNQRYAGFSDLPPHQSLPEAPPVKSSPHYLPDIEDNSPPTNSSISDSQHLLDADAQVAKLRQLRHVRNGLTPREDLVPAPLRLHNNAALCNFRLENNSTVATNESNEDPFYYDNHGCRTYVHNSMERDVSKPLRASILDSDHHPGQVVTDYQKTPARQVGNRKQKQLELDPGESCIESDRDSPYAKPNNSNPQKAMSNDVRGDWVTESTSELGSFRFCGGTTGSSIADYSDDDDKVIQHPAGGRFDSYGIRTINGFPENSIRLYSSAQKGRHPATRPSVPRKLSNPFSSHRRGKAINRLSFGFGRNTSSKYEFRDSISEYGLTGVSNKATRGTYESFDESGEYKYQSTTDARFDRSAEYNADRNPSAKISAFQDAHTSRAHKYDDERRVTPFPSAYGSRQAQDFCPKQFAAATSSRWDDEPSSIKSKFEFELLPLNLAQKKHKERRSEETDETDSTKDLIQRKKVVKSGKKTQKTKDIQTPARAHIRQAHLAHNLSSDFTPPSMDSYHDSLQDTPTPFSAAGKTLFSPISGSGKRGYYPPSSTLASPATPSSYYAGTPRTPASGWSKGDKSRLLPAEKGRGKGRAVRAHHGQNPFVGTRELSPSAALFRRNYWFCTMAILSILPFVAVPLLTGAFDDSLSWLTKGAYTRLSREQRKIIKWILLTECVLYTACIAAIIVYYVMKSKTSS
ncbi:hypothetical protein F4810DRAFT_699102 [Camillea tinctor]|nr:hypothetical protein F4810DRAFT_699102 [Camillea tinctor]